MRLREVLSPTNVAMIFSILFFNYSFVSEGLKKVKKPCAIGTELRKGYIEYDVYTLALKDSYLG